MKSAQDVLNFWFVEHDRSHWFGGGPAFDTELSAAFTETHAAVAAGEAWTWRTSSRGRLAEIIVLDQFSRQIHRGTATAFASDAMALALAQEAVAGGHLEALPEGPERMFLLLPYQHSESLLVHQETRRLFETLNDPEIMQFEAAHVAVLERFGRYPRRNAPLGRISTPEELAYCATDEGKW